MRGQPPLGHLHRARIGRLLDQLVSVAVLGHLHQQGVVTSDTDSVLRVPDQATLSPPGLPHHLSGLPIVVDYKGTSPDRMKKIKNEGSPESYKRQIQIYGWGYSKLGYQVNKVALAYFPRAGNIKDLHVEVFDYDPTVGPASVARIPDIAATLLTLDVINHPHRWEQVLAVASHDCGFCPWYNPQRSPEEGASDLGCPGK